MFSSTALLVIAAALTSPQTTPSKAPAPVTAQDQVIVTASDSPEPLDSVGRSVTVLTRQDLEALGISSVLDALRLAPGVDPQARGPFDVQTDLSIRGATFGQSLMLVDGERLNDSQTGHHDGDVPIAMAGLDRIEIVNGAGSATHGTDALGGTVNFITRTDPHVEADITGGQHGYTAAQASVSGAGIPRSLTLTGWFNRSDGFEFDREFATGGGALRADAWHGWTVDLRHQRKAFGADNFYGESPSKEWTDQTLADVARTTISGAWTRHVEFLARDHGDHFRWDINNPGFAENWHRTNAGDVAVSLSHQNAGGVRVTFGGDAGGDGVRSTNLGDHAYAHGAAFVEADAPLAGQTTLQASLRIDSYSTFGQSVSPSASISTWSGSHLKWRASAAHAFRIPTFTELYYHDPADIGTPTLRPEHGWSVDGGADWIDGAWSASISPFARWDMNVIDWVRATPDDLWQSTNVRSVTTTGVEGSVSRRWRAALVQVSLTDQAVSAPARTLLSKYVLAYAREAATVSVTVPLGTRLHLAVDEDYRHRYDGQRYSLVGLRLTRDLKRAAVFLQGENLLNAQYQEITGIDMPGRWIFAGVSLK